MDILKMDEYGSGTFVIFRSKESNNRYYVTGDYECGVVQEL